MIYRYSFRRSSLKDFLATQLQGARRYDRIAGFFSSSLLKVAAEVLERRTPDEGEDLRSGGLQLLPQSFGRVKSDFTEDMQDFNSPRSGH